MIAMQGSFLYAAKDTKIWHGALSRNNCQSLLLSVKLHRFVSRMNTDIIIIGAGAAGLAAAYELKKHGRSALVLEARARAGGRMHTIHEPGFLSPIEMGAEFVHGSLPVTLGLLEEYDITYEAMHGKMLQFDQGVFKVEHDFIEGSDEVEKKLRLVEEDMSVETFLNTMFESPKHDAIVHSVRRFVQGYDAADTRKASTLAFREEWLGEYQEQYRIAGGYEQLVKALVKNFEAGGTVIRFSTTVKAVRWSRSQVELSTANGEVFTASKLLMTVPLGIWQAEAGDEAAISFTPPLPGKVAAAHSLGYGTVIKVMLSFKEAFWESKNMQQHTGQNMEHLGFLFSDAAIPTWWTQQPAKDPVLTGWLAGPPAEALAKKSDGELLDLALNALVYIFSVSRGFIDGQLSAWKVANWSNDPFSKGAYSYATVHDAKAIEILARPVDDTLFFAGEALASGSDKSTVEAALVSGINAAAEMLGILK